MSEKEELVTSNFRYDDDQIDALLIQCHPDRDMAARRFLGLDGSGEVKGRKQIKREAEEMEKLQTVMKKRPQLDQGRCYSQTSESVGSNSRDDHKKLRGDGESAAPLHSVPISNPSGRILDGQPSSYRQSGPSATREAIHGIKNASNECQEEDCGTAAPSTNPDFSSHELNRILDPQAMPHRNLPPIGSHPVRVSGSEPLSSAQLPCNFSTLISTDVPIGLQDNAPQLAVPKNQSSANLGAICGDQLPQKITGNNFNLQNVEPLTFLQQQRPLWHSSARQPIVADNNSTPVPTGRISLTDGLIALQQNIPQEIRHTFLNNQSSASSSARAICGDQLLPQHIRGNNFQSHTHNPLHAGYEQSLFHSQNSGGQLRTVLNSIMLKWRNQLMAMLKSVDQLRMMNFGNQLRPMWNSMLLNFRTQLRMMLNSLNRLRLMLNSGNQLRMLDSGNQQGMPLQMNQQHVRRDPTDQQAPQMNLRHMGQNPVYQRALLMNQRHLGRDPSLLMNQLVRRNPDDSSHSGSQGPIPPQFHQTWQPGN